MLDYSVQQNSGLISGDDGSRYTFGGADWKGTSVPTAGVHVDFEVGPGGQGARNVYILGQSSTFGASWPNSGRPSAGIGTNSKSKIIAGLLAIFLGGLGIHKFYLDYPSQGVILLVASIIGVVTLLTGIGILILIGIWIVCLIEGVIYMTKSDEEFEMLHVQDRHPWF